MFGYSLLIRFDPSILFTRFRSQLAYEVIEAIAFVLILRDKSVEYNREDGKATRNLICSCSAILLQYKCKE